MKGFEKGRQTNKHGNSVSKKRDSPVKDWYFIAKFRGKQKDPTSILPNQARILQHVHSIKKLGCNRQQSTFRLDNHFQHSFKLWLPSMKSKDLPIGCWMNLLVTMVITTVNKSPTRYTVPCYDLEDFLNQLYYCKEISDTSTITHMLHVWYIYLHVGHL